MKKGKIFTNCLMSIFTLIVAISFNSCSADSNDAIDTEISSTVEAPFSLVLKAYSENKNITDKGEVDKTTLFVFDQNNDFFKQITVDRTYLLQVKPIEISCPGSDKITVIAWAGLNENEEISQMSKANIISDLQIRLKQNNGVVNALPSDLFYGQATLYRSTTKAAQELKLERKVSSVSLLTKGITKVFDSKEGEFFYKIKKSKSSFDCNGELTGEEVEYIIPASLNENGNLVAKATTILPDSDIVIELYKDNKMILSSKNLKNSEKASVNEGEQLSFVFDLSRNNCDITVSSWGTVIQYVTVG